MSIRESLRSVAKRAINGTGQTHLQRGNAAPELSIPDDRGKIVTIESLRGAPVVLYFYPKDETPGCTRQACSLRDEWPRIAATGAHLYGLSLDGVDAHARFIANHKLPFPLLADSRGDVATRYGVLRTIGPIKNVRRVSFVIDREGRIADIFDPVEPDEHTEKVLGALARMAP